MKQHNMVWIDRDKTATNDIAVVTYRNKSKVRHVLRTVGDKKNITIAENEKLMTLGFIEQLRMQLCLHDMELLKVVNTKGGKSHVEYHYCNKCNMATINTVFHEIKVGKRKN